MKARITAGLLDVEPLHLELLAQRRRRDVVVLLAHEEDMVVLVATAIHIAHPDLLITKETNRADDAVFANILQWECPGFRAGVFLVAA